MRDIGCPVGYARRRPEGVDAGIQAQEGPIKETMVNIGENNSDGVWGWYPSRGSNLDDNGTPLEREGGV